MPTRHAKTHRKIAESAAGLLSRFERHLYARCGLSPVTVYNHVSTMRRLTPLLGARPSHEDIEEHIASMMQTGASYAHVANTAVALEKYMDFLGDPIKLGRPAKPRRLVRGLLSEAEITLLIAAARSVREKAMLSVLAYAGLRNRELCRLRIRDVDSQAQIIHVEATKTQKERQAYIAPACVEVVNDYLRERNGRPNELLFTTLRSGRPYEPQCIRKMIRAAARRAGIKKRVYPHLLRHSLATNLLHRGAHLLAIKEQLGHVYVTTTMVYVQSSPAHTEMQYRAFAPSYL